MELYTGRALGDDSRGGEWYAWLSEMAAEAAERCGPGEVFLLITGILGASASQGWQLP